MMSSTSWLRISALVRKELRQIFRDPKTKRLVFGSPIIQLLLFGYAATTDVQHVATFIVDHDRTAESRALQSALTAGSYFRVSGRSDRPADMGAALDDGSAVVGVEIPPGFARDLGSGRGAHVQVLVDGTHSNTATVAQGYATRIIQQFGIDYAEQRDQLPEGGVDLRSRAWFNPGLESRLYNVPAILGVLLLLMCLLLTAMTVARERELGTLEQLMVSPLTPGELMLGKTIPVAIIALIDLAIISVVAIFWFRVPLQGSAVVLVAAASIYILASLSMGLFISSVSRTQQEAFMTMFLVILPAIVLSGFLYPVHTMPVAIQYLTLLNPVMHFLEIVRGIFLKGWGLADVWRQMLVLTLMAGVLLYGAARRFRASL
jgi:ABC-2 type transport system permease protein